MLSLERWALALADRYRIERELGRGGMSTVYLAEDLKHHRPVALKVLQPEVAAAVGQERFLREIEIAAQLSHPHILPLFDSGEVEGHFYYVMPYVAGESLRGRIRREGSLPLLEAVRITHQIASALGHAHQRGLVHRDIKPDNVLLSDDIPLIADFGIARVLGNAGTTAHTTVGVAIGTPAYMAPEQIVGSADVDARADVYSLGCVLHEMLTGAPPFGGSASDLARQHLATAPRPVSELRPDVPRSVSDVVAVALAKSPADRHASAARLAEALATAMTPLATASAVATTLTVPNNLPPERTRFIGREKELHRCAQLLDEVRLLTITGIGGCGKTRFALRLATAVSERFTDGVWLVDLGPLTDEMRVVEAVAAALGAKETPGEAPLDWIRKRLDSRHSLIILDNCEHVVRACAELVDGLLARTSPVRVIATSREGLSVDGERLVALPSLDVPAARAHDRAAVEASDAVRLFVDRARLALYDFALDERNAPAIAEICRRLDGIPLALELAAARVKVLSVEQIRARLDDRFRLLTGGSKSALPRHQTLQATLQWSYDQLASDEQALFRRLSVFKSGWTLDAATRVAGESDDEFAMMDVLTRLVDKSLVVVTREAATEPRYHLLETVRQYAADRLVEAGEAASTRSRHFAKFTELAERAYPERFVREDPWTARLETEHDNLRAALEFARDADAESYLRLAGSLAWFWHVRSHLLEGRDHLQAALARTPAQPPRPARARAVWGLANTLVWQGNGASAQPLMREALGIWRELGDRNEVAASLEGIGWAELLSGEDEAAQRTFVECLQLQRELGDPVRVNRAKVALAQVLVARHSVAEARALAEDIRAFSGPHGDVRSEHFAWHFLADCALIEGRCAESLDLYQQALRLAQPLGDRLEMSFEVQGCAMSLAGLGDAHSAVRLVAAARADWGRLGVDIRIRFWDELMERYLGPARRHLGDAAEAAEQEGAKIAFDDAMRMALAADVQTAKATLEAGPGPRS